MSEIIAKSTISESLNGVLQKKIYESMQVIDTSIPAYSRTIILKESPIKNFDEKFSYVRIDASEPIDVIFDGKLHSVKLFEILVGQPKSLSLKYHGDTEISINLVVGA